MGCLSKSIDADNNDKKPFFVPEKISDKLSKSIIRIGDGDKISTGFFIKINIIKIPYYFILTSADSISIKDINEKKTVSIFYGETEMEIEKKIELDNNKRFFKCFNEENKNLRATIIEILPEDNKK